jgi:hypothetical protein
LTGGSSIATGRFAPVGAIRPGRRMRPPHRLPIFA